MRLDAQMQKRKSEKNMQNGKEKKTKEAKKFTQSLREKGSENFLTFVLQ